ncbi:tetratricopeptide repeat protein [Rhodoferax sp. UBA5149]|uniref:tetratricopeptide repeat-containing glycosyltransferase family protein n=1 Tax=Rhodoferax sp. UBA5149 TaxID=1947379 RepID=UPI0025CE3E66|nr:tetratricopeptide repeat protein [Rhodoferax sp. UBA5149]
MTEPDPPSAETLFFEGNRHLAEGDAARAEACFRAALQLAPDLAELHANLGFLLDERGAATAAEACYVRAMALNPDISQVHLNFGSLLASHKRLEEAEAAYTRAILLAPESPVGWSNLGGLYAGQKRDAEAEVCCRQAMALDASYAKARFNLAYVLLRQGRYEEGWPCLEARDWYGALQAHLECPRWQGEPLTGKSLLIGYEAGHGDMIQFGRYAAVLKRQGAARITFLCHPALKTLFATLDGVDQVMAFDEPVPKAAWDCWTPLMSIPLYCQTRLDSIPAPIPYLHAEAERVARWRAHLPAQGLRVGLVWKGNPRFENDADRSLSSLALLLPLGQVGGVHFISLQKGAGEEQAMHPPEGLPLLHLGSQIDDFADTAAIVASLDLVICVDTAIAHLAGAMGKPCWVLLPDYKTDWRWLEGRTDSPWYPGVLRLFRQSAAGDWTSVVAQVKAALEAFLQKIGPGPTP